MGTMMQGLFLLMILATPAWADGLSNRVIDEPFNFPFDTGSNVDCDSAPTISLYEDSVDTPILAATAMTTQDAANTNGFYDYPYTLSAANGFEVGKTYKARYVCVLSGATRVAVDQFQVIASTVTLAAATHSGAVIPTVTTLTNLPSIPANWLTAAGIAAGALNGKGDWNIGKTGYSLTQAFPANFAALSITATTGLVDLTQAAADKVWASGTRSLTSYLDSSGVTTLLTRLPSALTLTGGNVHARVLTYAAGEAPIGTTGNPTLEGSEFVYGGQVADDAGGAVIDLGTTGISQDNQYAFSSRISFYSNTAPRDYLESGGCVIASNAAADTVTMEKNVSAVIAVNDWWAITEDGACNKLRPTVDGRTADVSATGGVAPDLSNVEGTLDDAEVGVLTALQVEMGQGCPGSPTANTAGDACQAAAQLPAAAAGGAGGVPTADASNAVKVQQGTAANQLNLSGGDVVVRALTTPWVGKVRCDVSAAGSSTSFTIASCLTPEGNSVTVADALFEAVYLQAYTNGGSPCNVEYQKVFAEDVTSGGVVTAMTTLRQGVTVGGFTATPSTTNCGVFVD